MKKIPARMLAAFLVLIMCVSVLSGCGATRNEQNNTTQAEQSTQPAEAEKTTQAEQSTQPAEAEKTTQPEPSTQPAEAEKTTQPEPSKEPVQVEKPVEISLAKPTEKFKVGVVVFSNTDLMIQAVNKYYNEYLGPEFNVEFIVSESIKDSNQEISFLENVASKGAKGIIAAYSVTDPRVLYNKCRELGLYYVWGMRNMEPKEFEAAIGNPFIIGGIGPATGDYEASYNMTKSFLDGGARKLGMATGGKDFGVKIFVDRYRGVKDAIRDFETKNPNAKIAFDEFGGFVTDAWFASQARMIASNPDAIIAPFSAEFLWLQPLTNAGKAGKIKMGAFSTVLPITAQAMADGKLHYVAAQYPQMAGPSFALLYNAMTGFSKDFTDKGDPVFVNIKLPEVTTAELMNKWLGVVNAKVPPYSVNDLKKVCKKFNPAATYRDFVNLAKAGSYDDIVARRSKGD